MPNGPSRGILILRVSCWSRGIRLLNLALCRSDAAVLSKVNLLALRDLVANPIGLLWRSCFRLLYRDGHRSSDVEHESESETWAPSQTKRPALNVTLVVRFQTTWKTDR